MVNSILDRYNYMIDPCLLDINIFRCIDLVAGCTVFGLAGNGTSRGSCNEMFNCHADGACKPHCTVRGSKGDGISRGSCAEGRICFSDGSCKVSGPICTVRGSKGDGISRGSCNEGQICFRDGSCKVPGLELQKFV